MTELDPEQLDPEQPDPEQPDLTQPEPAPLDPALLQLAEAYQVATEYWDWQGRHVQVAEHTVVAVLAALGVDATTPQARADALHAHHLAAWGHLLPPVVVAEAGEASSFAVHVPHGDQVSVWIDVEDGTRRDVVQLENWNPPREVDGRLVGEASFALPTDLPLGYHTIRSRAGEVEAEATLIVTPAWLGMPQRVGGGREWGLATQLYSVRSEGSWGIGDLTDLGDLACWAGAEHGAGYLLVNPLHAAEPTTPMEPSPYLPTSRRFTNPIYLRLEQVAEYTQLSPGDRAQVEQLGTEVQTWLTGQDVIDRDAVWQAKGSALAVLHAVPRTAGRELALAAYRRREGKGLEDYATWCALAEVHGALTEHWPDELRHPDSAAVREAAETLRERVDVHVWLQWLLDEQLAAAQSLARRSGMSIGIMHDLAVGVHRTGADAWAMQDVFAAGVAVGAPPDPYNQTGQTWAQPPWRPDRLAERAYQPFRQLVSTVLRHAGGVRVDHIIGLFRLWWIPDGALPTEGTYVRYDHRALIGILALEAHRAGAVVVGEDLGTVEPAARTYLREHGILGTSILWFEFDYDGDGGPLPPEAWREYCMASVTTHDLPPTAGYLAGDHVRLRHALGLLTRTLAEELAADGAERTAWLDDLRRRGGLGADVGGDAAGIEETVAALHRFLTWTPSRLLCLALTDAAGDRRAQNQPGTIDEYPNWRVPLTGPDGDLMMLEDVFTSRRAAALAEVLRLRH